jgi:hypothetical protein
MYRAIRKAGSPSVCSAIGVPFSLESGPAKHWSLSILEGIFFGEALSPVGVERAKEPDADGECAMLTILRFPLPVRAPL